MEYFVNTQILALTLIKTVLVCSFNKKMTARMLTSLPMKNSFNRIQKLRLIAEESFKKTAQLQQALAQIEAALSRKENQKVSEKSQKIKTCLYQEVSNF